MKKNVILILFLIVHFFVFSTTESKKDSLYSQLKIVSYNLKPKLLYEIANYHSELNEYKQAKLLSKRSTKLAKELKRNDIQILNLCLRAEIYRRTNNLDLALRTILTAIKIEVSNYYEAESERNIIFSRILSDMRACRSSLKYLKRNRDIWITKGSNLKKFIAMGDLGIGYLKLNKLNKSLDCFKKALYYKKREWRQLHSTTPQDNDLSNVHVYNNLGVLYAKLNKMDSALFYYKLATKMANRIKDKNRWEVLLYGYVQGNMGVALVRQGKFNEAFPYLIADFNIIQKYGESREKNNIALGMAEEYYIPMRNWDQAEKLIFSSIKEGEKNTIQNNQLRALKLLSDLYHKKGEIQKSHNYLSRYIACRDLVDGKKELITTKLSEELANYKINKVNDVLNNQKITFNSQRISYMIIIGFVLLTSLFLILLVRKRTKIQKELLELNTVKSRLAELEINAQQKEIDFKNKELEQFALHIIEKNNFLEKLKKELKSINNESNDPGKLKGIYFSINQKLNTELSRAEFELKLDNAQQAFLSKLEAKHPDLTGNEKRLCSLLLLKFSSKEIAEILNISLAGVNKSRQRLRKKLDLDSQTDLGNFFGN